jgi:CBS domain-containing protein
MIAAGDSVRSLSAADLMSRGVKTIPAGMSLPDAARDLTRLGIHGAPVVDDRGRCVGVLSATDLVRWVGRAELPVARVPACVFQAADREPGGQTTALCLLADGACPVQQARSLPDGTRVLVCTEPEGIPTDWQLVAGRPDPGKTVRDVMTTRVVSADANARVPELARLMLDRGVHRLIVLDPDERPVGVVSVNDLLQVLAHPEFVTEGESSNRH